MYSCNINQVSRRYMILATFPRQTRGLKLLMLIVAPSNDKETKSDLETGRTFATMFREADFRRKLLDAKSEHMLKGLVVLRSRELSKSNSFTNRHTYSLDPFVSHTINMIQERQDSDSQVSKLGSHTIMDKMTVSFSPNHDNSDTSYNSLQAHSKRHFDSNPRACVLLSQLELTANKLDQVKLNGDQLAKSMHIDQSRQNCLSFLLQHVEFGNGICDDLTRRIGLHYISDFRDAFYGPPGTIRKTIATIWFLYFGILLPIIAFDSLNYTQTNGNMGGLSKSILGQAIGGLAFALLGGQPLVIIMTTAPLCLYTKG